MYPEHSVKVFFFQGEMYLVKWSGYHVSESTWEPKSHFTPEILRSYERPEITIDRLQYAAQHLEKAVQQHLSSNGNRSVIDFDADVFRFCFGPQPIQILYLEDFKKLPLSASWLYKLRRNGRGTQLSFPVRIKSRIHIKKSYVAENVKELCTPVGRLVITSATDGMCIYNY